jgi:hypothetical protein
MPMRYYASAYSLISSVSEDNLASGGEHIEVLMRFRLRIVADTDEAYGAGGFAKMKL